MLEMDYEEGFIELESVRGSVYYYFKFLRGVKYLELRRFFICI